MLDDIIELVLDLFFDIIVEGLFSENIPRPFRIFCASVMLIVLFGGSGLLIGFGIANQTTWMLMAGIALLIVTIIWFVYLARKYRREMQQNR